MLHHCLVREGAADLAERLHRLLPHHRLLDTRQGLQGRQHAVRVRWAAHVGHEVAQLLRHGQQHLVLVVIVLCEEGDELRARALLAQREGDRAEPVDRVQAAHRLVILELIAAGGAAGGVSRAGGPRARGGHQGISAGVWARVRGAGRRAGSKRGSHQHGHGVEIVRGHRGRAWLGGC